MAFYSTFAACDCDIQPSHKRLWKTDSEDFADVRARCILGCGRRFPRDQKPFCRALRQGVVGCWDNPNPFCCVSGVCYTATDFNVATSPKPCSRFGLGRTRSIILRYPPSNL